MSNQTAPSYTMNPEDAKQVGVSSFIDEKGAYVGTFTRAEAVVSEQGTHGIELSFKSDTGPSAEYLTLWTVNADGKDVYGRKVLDAVLVAMRLRGIQPEAGKVMKRNRQTGRDEMTNATVFKALMGKPIGLLMVREEYAKTGAGGGTGWKMVVVGTFDAKTNQTPREILESKPAESLVGMVEALRDRPLKARANNRQRTTGGDAGGGFGGGFGGPDGDDIPF